MSGNNQLNSRSRLGSCERRERARILVARQHSRVLSMVFTGLAAQYFGRLQW